MMQAVKEDWWIISSTSIIYYDLTRHRIGNTESNSYIVKDINGEDGVNELLQRREAGGTIRETDIPNYPRYRFDTAFKEGDIVASTLPLIELKDLQARFHQVKELLFNPSIDTPNLRTLQLRGNWTSLGNLDMRNCRKLEILDISQCYINSLQLPSTNSNDIDNYFYWGYIGHFGDIGGRTDMPPVQVVDQITKRAYYSKISPTSGAGTGYKHISSDPANGHLFIDGINMHKDLVVNKGWKVQHLSLESFDLTFSNIEQTKDFKLMTSNHDWELNIDVDWVTSNQYIGVSADDVQTIQLSIAPNTTGVTRSTHLKFRKIKRYPKSTGRPEEDWTEMHHKALVKITQN